MPMGSPGRALAYPSDPQHTWPVVPSFAIQVPALDSLSSSRWWLTLTGLTPYFAARERTVGRHRNVLGRSCPPMRPSQVGNSAHLTLPGEMARGQWLQAFRSGRSLCGNSLHRQGRI
jgi:hypothetical protein